MTTFKQERLSSRRMRITALVVSACTGLTFGGLTTTPAHAADPHWVGTVKTDETSSQAQVFVEQKTTYTLDGASSSFTSTYEQHDTIASECGPIHKDYNAVGAGPYTSLDFEVFEQDADTHQFVAKLFGDVEHLHTGTVVSQACTPNSPDPGWHVETGSSDFSIVVYPPSDLGCATTQFDVVPGIQAIRGTVNKTCGDSVQNNSQWDYAVKLEPCDTAVDSDHDGMGDCDEYDVGRDPMNPFDGDPNADTDGDGVHDDVDNCRSTSNPDQADQDGDHLGDACDADIDGDGQPNETDPCPLDSTDSCKDPNFSCTSPGAQQKLVAPKYDAKVELAFLPDVDLFHFAPSLVACWDGTSAVWKDNGGILGDTDGGLDEVILNQFGFDLEYDSFKEQTTVDNAPASPTAEVTSDFNFVFHIMALIDKLGVKKKLEGKVTNRVADNLRDWLKKNNVTGPKFGDELRLQGRLFTTEVEQAATTFRSKLRALHVPRKIADPVADKLEAAINKKTREFRQKIGALSHSNAFQKLAADKMAEKMVGKLFALLDPKVTIIVWRPNYVYTLSPDGFVSQSDGARAYANPFLTIADEG